MYRPILLRMGVALDRFRVFVKGENRFPHRGFKICRRRSRPVFFDTLKIIAGETACITE
ncbi:MAG: hypothetical protein ACYC9O_12445 [Candidatus Latescibacterota bacterium]